MRKSIASTSLIAATLLTTLAILAPATASAREGGARSVGKGIKCYTAGVVQANGTVKYQQVCYKGV